MVKDYVGLIIENNKGELLFQLRDNNPKIKNKNQWSLFGGGIERGETPKQAAIRELKEELDLAIKKEQLRLLAVFPNYQKKNYLFRLKLNENTKLKLMEGSSMGYFTVGEILRKKNVVKSLRLFLLFYPLIHSVKKENQ